MVHLFDPENRFWAFVGKLADVFCLSLLWLLTSLPVVTAGAATAAFYHFSIHQVNDTESTVWHGFFAAFRRFFKKATLLWLMEAAGFAFLGCDLWLAWRYFESVGGGAAAVGILAVIACVTILFGISMLYAWPILATFDFPLKKTLSNSFVMAVGNLPTTITVALLFAAACVGTYYLSGLFFFWFGLAVFLSAYFFVGVFKKYTGERAEEEAARAAARSERKARGM